MRAIASLFCSVVMMGPGATCLAQPAAAAATLGVASTPAARATLTMLNQVCVPRVLDGKPKTVARSLGLRNENGQWILPIDEKRRAVLLPPDKANPYICQAQITHQIGAQASIRSALDAWAKSRTPPFSRVDVLKPSTGPLYRLLASSWAGQTANGSLDVVLSEQKTLQGKPVDSDLDRSVLIVGFTPRNPSTPA